MGFYRDAWNAHAVLQWEFCLSVRLSLCLSVKRVHCYKTEERYAYIFIPYERPFSLVFWEEWLVGATPSTLNFGLTGPHWSKIANLEPIIARSTSVITPSEKSSINTNKKSPMCFPISPRCSTYVAPESPKRGWKMQNGNFLSKIALCLKKVCYKVYSCENCQQQSCRAFIGLTIHAKMICGKRLLLPEILGQSDRVGAKSLRAFQWAQDEHRMLSLSPKGWLKNAKCPKFEQ